jgi:hypothetical protein
MWPHRRYYAREMLWRAQKKEKWFDVEAVSKNVEKNPNDKYK